MTPLKTRINTEMLVCFFCVLVTCKKASKQAAMLVLFGNLHQYRRLKERHSTDVSF